MQAVILAGGLGTRLGDITKQVPKPMVPVAGVPYLEHQLRLLREQAITNVVLLTGYLAEQIEEHFGDGGRLGLSIRYSREEVPLGTGGALRQARDLLEDTFLLIYGDSYLPIDYRAVLMKLRESTAIGLVVAYQDRVGLTSVQKNLAIDRDDYVLRYEKDTAATGLDYVEAGVLAFRQQVLDYLPATREVSLEKDVFPKLIAEHRMIAAVTEQRFYDIGTPDRLEVINRLFA